MKQGDLSLIQDLLHQNNLTHDVDMSFSCRCVVITGILCFATYFVNNNSSLWISLTALKTSWQKIFKIPKTRFFKLNKYTWQLNIKHILKKRIIVGQWEIAANVPPHVYFAVIQIEIFLITHHSNVYCKPSISNKYLCIVLQLMNTTLIGS